MNIHIVLIYIHTRVEMCLCLLVLMRVGLYVQYVGCHYCKVKQLPYAHSLKYPFTGTSHVYIVSPAKSVNKGKMRVSEQN